MADLNVPVVLRTWIRQLAHWYEKSFFSEGNWYRGQARALARQLTAALSQWRQTESTLPADIAWAQMVLDQKLTAIPPEKPPVSADQVLALLRQRRSCRAWRSDAVSDADLDHLLQAALWAPSSANRQSLLFFLIRSAPPKKALAELVKHGFLAHAPVLILIGIDTRSYHHHEHDRMVADAAVAAENMMVYATASTLGTCLITPHEIESPAFKAPYAIPPYCHLFMILAVGHPQQTFAAPPRMGISDHLMGSV